MQLVRDKTMKKLIVVGMAVVLLLGGALYALVRPWHCPVNRVTFERIKEGMTQADVYAILGGPPGDYRTRPPAPLEFVVTERRAEKETNQIGR
jgi:hypothetical protein